MNQSINQPLRGGGRTGAFATLLEAPKKSIYSNRIVKYSTKAVITYSIILPWPPQVLSAALTVLWGRSQGESLGSRDPSPENLSAKPKMLCWYKNGFYTTRFFQYHLGGYSYMSPRHAPS